MAFDPVTALVQVGGKLVDRILPDRAAAEAAKAEIEKLQLSGELQLIAAQLQVNANEANNANLFVSGWRPFVGWVCGVALAYTYLVYPLGLWAMALLAPGTVPPQLLNGDLLYQLLFGMLGLGTLRTMEKIKKVAS